MRIDEFLKNGYLVFLNILLLVFLLGTPLLPSIVGMKGSVITVDDSGGADYLRIQDAIYNAHSGDTIFVYNGTYHENVIVPLPLTIVGERAVSTIIENPGTIVTILAPDVTLDSFTIRNASTYGVLLDNTNNVSLQRCIITNSYSFGVYVIGCSHCTIQDTSSHHNHRYGFYLRLSHDCELNRCTTFENNNQYYHDHGFMFNGVVNVTSIDCVSYNNYYGFYLDYSESCTLLRCTAYGNAGYGIHLYDTDTSTMTDCVCHHNAGFGFFLEHADFCVIQHAICHHTNIGILLYYATNNTIQNSETSNNSWAGIEIRDVSNDNTVINCSTHHNREGIMILVSLDNILYHNNMYSNYENGYDDSFNSWDNAYPNGGNYWSDYHGVDDYSGEEQLVPGSDGIGDTPYQINGSGSIDRYPFMVSNGWMNQAPATPQQPQGPLHGCIGFTYTFYTYAVDPDDDALYYMWDWGDQTIELLGPNPSGIVFNASHRWNTSGSYSIRVKVQDSHGLESAWSEPLVVIIKTMINDHFYIHY